MEGVRQKAVSRPAVVQPAAASVAVRAPPGVSTSLIQTASLKVSSPADPAEKEADATAKRIMRMSLPDVAAPAHLGSPSTARFTATRAMLARKADGAGTVTSSVRADIQSASGAGTPLPGGVRRFMEPRFGVDFGDVRVHTGDHAARLSRQLNARAFTLGNQVFFGRDQFRPESREGKELIAHELTHTVQQGAAVRRSEATPVTHTVAPHVQRLGLSDALDYFADKANLIPGFRMFTIVLGVNPVNMSRVERSAANILRAVVEFMPGGGLITRALDAYGVFERVGAWIERQLTSLGITGASIRAAIDQFLHSLSWTDIFDLGGVWSRAKRILGDPIGRIITFVGNLAGEVLKIIKDAILRPLAALASQTRAWDLLCAVLGRNPITGDAVPRNAETLIGGFMKLIGQEEIWQNIKRGNAVARAWAWFQTALAGLMGFVQQVPQLFLDAVRALTIEDIVVLPMAFAKVARAFGDFVGRFFSWAGGTTWNLLEIVFDVVSPGALGYIKRTGAALRSILRNPLPFVGNLVKAAKLGFTNFAANIGAHLKAGLIEWLTGSLPGVYIPKAFSLAELVKFVFSVLGLSWANARQKLVKVVGEPAVKTMEAGFDIVVTLVRDGPAAAWDKIKEQLASLQGDVVDGIISFVVDAVVKKAVPKLIAMFIPGAGFISAILSIYDTVMVFVQKLSKIAQVVKGFVDSIVAIAQGQIGGAAARVEGALAGLLSLAISFLAGFVGLGKVADKVMGVIEKVRGTVDKALDWLINWIATTAKKLFAKAFAKDKKDNRTEEQKKADLKSAMAEAEVAIANKELSLEDVARKVAAIKRTYNIAILEVRTTEESNTGQTNYVYGEINPTERTPGYKRRLRFTPPVEETFECSALHVKDRLREEFDTQVKDQESGLNRLSLENWDANVTSYLNRKAATAAESESGSGSGRDPKGTKAQHAFRKEYRDRRIKEEIARDVSQRSASEKERLARIKVNKEMEDLAALHDPDQIAGGDPTKISRLGDKRVNSSIGSQWRKKAPNFISRIRERVADIAKSIWKRVRLNVKLNTV